MHGQKGTVRLDIYIFLKYSNHIVGFPLLVCLISCANETALRCLFATLRHLYFRGFTPPQGFAVEHLYFFIFVFFFVQFCRTT